MKKFKLLLLSITFLFLFVSCGDDNPVVDNNPSGGLETKFDVTFTDNTIYIDSNNTASLKDYDNENEIFYFDKNLSKLANAKVGDILFIHALALRKITKITEQGNELKIETEYATLDEAIKDGEISWNKEINFKNGEAPKVLFKDKVYDVPLITDDGFEFEIKFEPYTYKVRFKYADNSAEVMLEISKDMAGEIKGKFVCEGTLQKFNSKADLKYQNSKLTKFNQTNDNLKGDLTLSLVVAGSGRDQITFELPVVLLKFPVLVGSIPVVINVKVFFVVNCVVPVDGSSNISVKFNYNSSTGIKFDGVNVSADGSIGSYNINKEQAQTGASGAVGANFGLGFPRLEISMFNDIIVPWIHTAFLIGGDFTFTPPCQRALSRYIGAYGLDLKFLGFSYSATKTIWDEEKVLLKSGDCP